MNTGAGDDRVTVGSTMEIDGSASVNLGEGANDFDTLALGSILGNLWLSVGNGDNLAMSLAGTVGGTLALFQGNGANGTVTISTVPARLLYRGGNGGAAATDNVIDLAGTGTYLVDMVYGTGFGGLTLSGGATQTLTGIVVGTGGTYAFNQGAAVLAPELVFINFP
ncbi:MAG: hypothetical protein U0797_15045 [Gemmataceae bacterium]